MLLRDLLEKTEIIELAADPDMEIRGVCFDTRTLRPGELFVAVSGYERDGHEYIGEAVLKGAVCVICEKAPGVKPRDAGPQDAETTGAGSRDAREQVVSAPYILVDDSRIALAAVSAAWFGNPASKLKIIGVTGTNGKTTVTNLIKNVIEKCSGEKAGLIGTNWNMIGERFLDAERTTPESYEIQELLDMMVREGCRYAVMEVSSHALYLNRVYGIEFDVGVFTNISQDHMDFHASMDEYAGAKASMFRNCRSAAINLDDGRAQAMIDNAKGAVLTYAVKNDAADLVAKSIKLGTDKVEFCALTIGKLNRAELGIPGMFTVYNALSVMAAAMLSGFDIERAAAALQTCEGVKGRAEIVPTGRDFTVLIDYAHTPDALMNIITAARGFAEGRVVTLFGCGGDRDRSKRPKMGEIAAAYSDFVVVTSDNPRTEEPAAIIAGILAGMEGTKTPFQVIEARREAIGWALDNSEPGDVLILAGKGHETYQILGREKTHFDEREVVAERLMSVECRV